MIDSMTKPRTHPSGWSSLKEFALDISLEATAWTAGATAAHNALTAKEIGQLFAGLGTSTRKLGEWAHEAAARGLLREDPPGVFRPTLELKDPNLRTSLDRYVGSPEFREKFLTDEEFRTWVSNPDNLLALMED